MKKRRYHPGLVVEDGRWATKEYAPKENHNGLLSKGFEFVGDKERVARWSNAQDMMMFGYWMLHWADKSVQQVKFIDEQSGNIQSIQQPSG